MTESIRSSAVIDLRMYRDQAAKKQERHPPPIPPSEKLLDEVSYHLLMAVRAIAAHTAK